MKHETPLTFILMAVVLGLCLILLLPVVWALVEYLGGAR